MFFFGSILHFWLRTLTVGMVVRRCLIVCFDDLELSLGRRFRRINVSFVPRLIFGSERASIGYVPGTKHIASRDRDSSMIASYMN